MWREFAGTHCCVAEQAKRGRHDQTCSTPPGYLPGGRVAESERRRIQDRELATGTPVQLPPSVHSLSLGRVQPPKMCDARLPS